MAKIRVMLTCNLLDLGGTEKAIQIFAKYLDKSRFEVFACGRWRGGVRVAELEKMGIPVILQPPDITKLVRELKIDIYHISRAGDYEPGSLPEKANGWPRIVETNIFNAIDKQENDRIDCYLFPSRWSKDIYVGRHGMRSKARYEALYLPVDFEEFPVHAKEFTATIGRCSRADDQKWHDVCVDSLPKIFRKVPEARCLFQGATDRVKARLAELGLTGRVELSDTSVHLRDFYPRLDVYTHGARVGEGFGVVMAEAMANRLPVVTIATPGRKKSNAQGEVVEHNITGFVCRWRWQYAGAVIELLRNHPLREKMGQRGYDKAREEFEASRLTRRLEALYTDLMDHPN